MPTWKCWNQANLARGPAIWGAHISLFFLPIGFVVVVLSYSLRPHELWPIRFPCLWDFPGKNTGVGCHSLLQGIFPTQGLNPHLLHWQVNSLVLSHLGSTPTKRPKTKKMDYNKWKNWSRWIIGEIVTWFSHLGKKVWQLLKMLAMSYDPAIPVLGIIAPNGKQPKMSISWWKR